MRGRTYSTPFQDMVYDFGENPTFSKIRVFPKHDVTGENPTFSKIRVFPKHDVTGENPTFSKIRVFPKHDVIGENPTFVLKTRVLSKTRTFHKYMLKLLLYFISYCFSGHCLSLRVTRCLWKTIENILRGG